MIRNIDSLKEKIIQHFEKVKINGSWICRAHLYFH
jgi:hypothetical protein